MRACDKRDGLADEAALQLRPRSRHVKWDTLSQSASSGKCVPELMLGMGCVFRIDRQRKMNPGIGAQSGMLFPFAALAENESQNRASKWDALSQRACSGKLHPRIRPQSGIHFPKAVPAEDASQNRRSKWDAFSQRPASGKCVPVRQRDNRSILVYLRTQATVHYS